MLHLFNRNLDDALNNTKTIKIQGVVFKIKKIDAFDFMDGSKSVLQMHEIYQSRPSKADASAKKIKEHYRDVIMSGVVQPKLSREDDGSGVYVDDLFNDWSITEGLYSAIIEHTYSKKKSIFGSFLGNGS